MMSLHWLHEKPKAESTVSRNSYIPLIMVLTKLLDVDGQAVPPRWPARPSDIDGTGDVYDLRSVSTNSIAMVTTRSLKVIYLLLSVMDCQMF